MLSIAQTAPQSHIESPSPWRPERAISPRAAWCCPGGPRRSGSSRVLVAASVDFRRRSGCPAPRVRDLHYRVGSAEFSMICVGPGRRDM